MLINYARENDIKYVCGMDETGWGSFAGPIVTAAVILPPDFESDLIVDSKLICKSKKKFLKAYQTVINNALSVSCTAISATVINSTKPMEVLTQCFHNSINELTIKPEHLLIDGDKYITGHNIPFSLHPKGDNKFLSIAAASIVAKFRRDEYMIKLDKLYPQYNFKGNKGYYCNKHKEGLLKYGKTKYHRDKYVNTWLKNKKLSLP